MRFRDYERIQRHLSLLDKRNEIANYDPLHIGIGGQSEFFHLEQERTSEWRNLAIELEYAADWLSHHKSSSKWRDIDICSVDQLKQILNVIKAARDAQDTNPQATLLHWAAHCGALRLIKEFLEDSACNPMAQDVKGRTALDVAIRNNQKEAAEILRRHLKKYGYIEKISSLTEQCGLAVQQLLINKSLRFRNVPVKEINSSAMPRELIEKYNFCFFAQLDKAVSSSNDSTPPRPSSSPSWCLML
jgi:ankyrin repeat protein